MQWVRNWGSSWGRNAGLSPFLPEPGAWAKVAIEGRPRGPAWQGDGGELCFGLSKSRVEQPNLSLHGQIQGCRASRPWSRDDAPGLTTLAELGVLVGAGERGSESGSCAAGAWGAGRGPVQVPAWWGFFLCKCLGAAALPA